MINPINLPILVYCHNLPNLNKDLEALQKVSMNLFYRDPHLVLHTRFYLSSNIKTLGPQKYAVCYWPNRGNPKFKMDVDESD